MRFRRAIRAGLPLLMLALVAGACSKKATDPRASESSTFVGTLAGGAGAAAVSGSLTVTLGGTAVAASVASARSAAAGTASGTLVISGNAIALSGTYDDASGTLVLTGGGYTLSGTRAGATLSGTFDAAGPVVGGFVLAQSSGTTPKVYCGTYASSTPGVAAGTIDLVISGTSVAGLAVNGQTGEVHVLNGTISGASISIPNPDDGTLPSFATGNLDANTDSASGAWNDGAGTSGNWNASRC
jgi:hypothetical protein